MKRLLIILFFVFLWRCALAGEEHLLPRPQQVEWGEGHFSARKVRLLTDVPSRSWEEWLQECGMKADGRAASRIEVSLTDTLPEVGNNPAEAYRLTVETHRIRVEALTGRGLYWAMQTLRQLRDDRGRFRCCRITDWPSFRIRGFMHDVGRGYIPIEELKREIELLSRFKINTFHWHLTENQAWRLESRRYPRLTARENMTRFEGCFYTREEVRSLVEFARRCHVEVIPEIDMPGHSAAFVRAFGCDMQSDRGMSLLKELLDEALELFDSEYIHIGTDEVAFSRRDFVPEMVAHLRARGRKVISWNPGWHYRPGEIDMTQLWSARGQVQEGIPAIDSRFHYLNHYDTFADLVALYNSRIANVECGSEGVAGVILAVWNDRLIPDYRDLLRQNHLYPNMLAVAERAWLGGGDRYFDGEGVMLPTDPSSEVFAAFADFERRLLWHKEHTLRHEPVAYVRQSNVRWEISDPFPNGGDLQKVFAPEREAWSGCFEERGRRYGVREAVGAGIYLRHVWGGLVPAFYRAAPENHTAYAHTWVYSPRTQRVGAWLETQNYSRSEKDVPPPQGKWDYRESRLWINGSEVAAPEWSASHRLPDNETALGNENCVVRRPVEVLLHKGWNEVLWKLPVGEFRSAQTRLVKWMFTTVFVTPDGERAVDGLIYSPRKKL